jgi:hypothetical protein
MKKEKCRFCFLVPQWHYRAWRKWVEVILMTIILLATSSTADQKYDTLTPEKLKDITVTSAVAYRAEITTVWVNDSSQDTTINGYRIYRTEIPAECIAEALRSGPSEDRILEICGFGCASAHGYLILNNKFRIAVACGYVPHRAAKSMGLLFSLSGHSCRMVTYPIPCYQKLKFSNVSHSKGEQNIFRDIRQTKNKVTNGQ